MARKSSKILLTGWGRDKLCEDSRFLGRCWLWRARRELNPGQPGVFREVKASPEVALPVLFLFRIPARNLAELRGRPAAAFYLVYISLFSKQDKNAIGKNNLPPHTIPHIQ